MKLKTIYIIFNILIGVSFLFVFLMPALFLGWSYAGLFWSSNWYLILLFLGVFAVLNIYFYNNWALFSALEQEDWDGVISVLEQRMFKNHSISTGNVKLLVNAYVIRSRSDSIRDLEQVIREEKPQALTRNALVLGIPHLLSNDGEEIVSYYGEFISDSTGTSRRDDWLRWCYAFGLMLQQKTEQAKETLISICTTGKDVVVRALSAYLLEAYAGDSDERDTVTSCRTAITEKHSKADWERRVEGARSDLYVLILSKLLRDVTEWLYGKEE